MTLYDTQMRPRQNRVIAWDGPGSKTKGAKKNGKLSYWGEGDRRCEAWRNAFYATDPPLTTVICKWPLTWDGIEKAYHSYGYLL